MANFTTEVNSIMGTAGTTAGTPTITLKITPNEGFYLLADDFDILPAENTNFENIVKGTVQEDGTLSFTLDLIDSINFGDADAYNITLDSSLHEDARPLEPRVYGDCTFVDDANINFTVRDIDGNVVESQILPIDASGERLYPDDSEIYYIVGEVDIDRVDDMVQTAEPTITSNEGTLRLIYPAENANGGYTYSIVAIMPLSDEDITHTFDNSTITLDANPASKSEDCLEIRTIDVDSGDLDPTTGGTIVVTVKGDEGAAGTLTLTPTVEGVNSQGISLEVQTVEVLIGSKGIFVENVQVAGPTSTTDALGNACQPQVPDDVDGVSWETSFVPDTDNCFVGKMPDPIMQDEGTTVCFQVATSDGTYDENTLLGPSMRGSAFEGGIIEEVFVATDWNFTVAGLSDGDTYTIDIVNDIKIVYGTDTGTEFCNGTATISADGTTLTVRLEYTPGTFQDVNTKYIVCIDNFAMISGSAVSVSFSKGNTSDAYSFSQMAYDYIVPTGSSLDSTGGLTPNFVFLTADEGYTWQDVTPTVATTGTGLTLVDSTEVAITVDGTDGLDTSGDTVISVLRLTWEFHETVEASIPDPADILFTVTGTPNKIVTTSFDTGADNTGQASLSDSTFMPIDPVVGVAGRTYSTEYFITPNEDHVFNASGFPTGVYHSGATATVGSSAIQDAAVDINGAPRHRMLRGAISGTHGADDSTVLIDGNGGGLRVVDLHYTVTNNASNTTVDFAETIQVVEGDMITGKTIVATPIDSHEYGDGAPTLTIDGDTETFGSGRDHTHTLGDFTIGDSDHTVHAVVGGSPTVRPVNVTVVYDLSSIVGVEAIADATFEVLPGETEDLMTRISASEGYEFNDIGNISLSYPPEFSPTPAFNSDDTWGQDSTFTVPSNTEPGSSLTLTITATQLSALTVLINLEITGNTSFPALGGDSVFTITTDDPLGYTVEVTGGWTFDEDTLTASILGHDDPTTVVNGTITATSVTNTAVSQTLNLTQASADVTLSIDPNELSLGAAAGSNGSVTVNSNHTWSVSGLNDGFVASSTDSSPFVITVAGENTGSVPRTSTFQVTSDFLPGKDTVVANGVVTQAVAERTVTVELVDTGYDNGGWMTTSPFELTGLVGSTQTASVAIQADADYTVYEANIDGTPSIAYSVDKKNDNDPDTDYFSVSPLTNSATATVTAIIPAADRTVVLNVEGAAQDSDGPLFVQKPEIQVELGSDVSVEQTTAEIQYRVISDGNDPLTFHQLWLGAPGAYNATTGPRYDLTRTVSTSGAPDYTHLLEGLLPDTNYAYLTIARNSQGEVYGTPVAQSFRTAAAPPAPVIHTATLSVIEDFNNNSFVNTTGNGQTRMGTAGQTWSFTTTVAPISSQHDIAGNPTFSSSHGTVSGSNRSRTITGTFGNSNVNVTATWGGTALALPQPEPPKPLFTISATNTSPNQDGSGASINATWSGNIYTSWSVDFRDSGGSLLSGFPSFSHNGNSAVLNQSALGIPANTSTSPRDIFVTVTARANSSYSNANQNVSTQFQWVQPGVSPADTSGSFDEVDLLIYDEIIGASVSKTSLSGISAGDFINFAFYLSTEDGYITPTTEEVSELITLLSDGFLDLASVGFFRYYNVIQVNVNVNDDAVFTQDTYDLRLNGAFMQEASIDRCTVKGVQGTITNCTVTTSERTYRTGEGSRPFFKVTPNDGYEFTSATDVSTSGLTLTSPIHADFPRNPPESGNPSSINIHTHDTAPDDRTEPGDISVYIQPKASGFFNEEEYTVTINAVATQKQTAVATAAPVVQVHSRWSNNLVGVFSEALQPNATERDVTSYTYIVILKPDPNMLPCTVEFFHDLDTTRASGANKALPVDLQQSINNLNWEGPRAAGAGGGYRGQFESQTITINPGHPITTTTYDIDPVSIPYYGPVGEDRSSHTGYRVDFTFNRPGGGGAGSIWETDLTDNGYAPDALGHEGNGLRQCNYQGAWRLTNQVILDRPLNVRGDVVRHSGEVFSFNDYWINHGPTDIP